MKSSSRSICVAALARAIGLSMGCLMYGAAIATPVLDQVNDTIGPAYFNGDSTSHIWQQGVTVGLSGTLHSIEVYFEDYLTSNGIRFFVNSGHPWQNDLDDFTATISLVAGWNRINVSTAGIGVAVGETFVFGIQGLGSDFPPNFRGTLDDAYPAGLLYVFGDPYVHDGYDINFRSYVETGGTVPEPATLALVSAGLFGAAATRRRRAGLQ